MSKKNFRCGSVAGVSSGKEAFSSAGKVRSWKKHRVRGNAQSAGKCTEQRKNTYAALTMKT